MSFFPTRASLTNTVGAVLIMLGATAMGPGAAGAAGAPVKDFALAPGDVLRFDILDDDKEPVDLNVGTDGQVQVPLLGAVPVSGLTAAEAQEAVKKLYVEQQIFLAPRIALSVATFRPVYVVGDVRNPGSYPFEPDLTVEKALGLAGGQIVAGAQADPVMMRARLHSQMDTIDTEIIRASLSIGRINAQLAGRNDILPEDLPEEGRAYVEGPVAAGLRSVQLTILSSELEAYEAQKKVLEQGVAEAEKGQALFEELTGKTEKAVEFSRAELERTQSLKEKGIKTLADVANVERQLTMEEARQLQVMANISDGRRGLLNLRQQLVQIDVTRKMKALDDLLAEKSKLAASISERRAAEEQLMLLTTQTTDDLQKAREIVLDFTIRHGSGEATVDIRAASSTTLSPGDVLVVRIGTPTDPAATASLPATAPAAASDAATQ
jgi:exopolysaccharide production protein ExoF